jgi:integrase
MARRTLNDRIIKAIKPARAGQRHEVWDALVPGLGVRTTDTGGKTFVLATRYPGSKNPARRKLGGYGELTLEEARGKARAWLALVARGMDPEQEVERQRLAEQRKRSTTFAAVAEDFIADKCSKERQAYEATRIVRRELIPVWGDRAITEIAPLDVITLLRPIKARGPAMAHAVLTVIKRLFGWAVDAHVYGLETSPADRLKAKRIIGELHPRQRVLSDPEIIAFWRAASRMRYPHGPLLQLLLLTACRHHELADAPWSEFDLTARVWTIAQERFKSNAVHRVPLVDDVFAILKELPRFKGGGFVFSTTSGARPSRCSDKVKLQLDRRMLHTLKAMARMRGEDPNAVELRPWVIHDLRRVVRSHLAALRLPDHICEMVLGHGKKGLQRIYDQHAYESEIGEALTMWAARLRSIVNPPAANVVPLKARVS